MDRNEGLLVGTIVEWGATDEGQPLSMNVLRASTNVSRKAPVVLHVHGGGWAGGSHLNLPPSWMRESDAGFVIASVEYQLAPKLTDLDTIVQILEAWSWLEGVGAKKLGIDPTKIWLAGESTGGFYALIAAGWSRKTPRGIVAYSAPTDLSTMMDFPPNVAPAVDWSAEGSGLRLWTGEPLGETNPQLSPTYHADCFECPIFLAHAEDDPIVSSRQFERMVNALDWNVNVDLEQHLVAGVAHGWRLGDMVDTNRCDFMRKITPP